MCRASDSLPSAEFVINRVAGRDDSDICNTCTADVGVCVDRGETHSLRKPVATLVDDEGLSARIGADHLGHSRVSNTR